MNPDFDDIEVLPDDMGEGLVEPINPNENENDKLQRKLWRLEEKLRRKQQNPGR